MRIATGVGWLCVVVFATSSLAQEFLRLPMDEYVGRMKAGWVGQMVGVGWGGPTEFDYKPAYDVRDDGAVGDGKTLSTSAIQKTIDRCAADGGGTVHLPPGTYLSGTLFLKDGVTLNVDAGATLLGSPNPEHYPEIEPALRSYTDRYVCQSLIFAQQVEGVGLCGRGTIDGSGEAFHGKPWRARPYVIRLVQCRDVTVEGLTLRNSPMWMQHYLACERLRIRALRVFNHGNANNDGLDIDACSDVIVSDCTIDSDDDALCLKSTLDRACENVTVTNCVLRSRCSALKTGTESHGGFRNIVISNLAIRDTNKAGIALLNVDGGVMDRVTVSNINMHNVGVPIFIRLGDRGRTVVDGAPKAPVGAMSNIILSNIQADGAGAAGCPISGIPGHPIRNLTLENIRLDCRGGGGSDHALRQVPEKVNSYPHFQMFGTLPGYGFYCRHAENVRFEHLDLAFKKVDDRPALMVEDVRDLSLVDLAAQGTAAARAVVCLRQVEGAMIRGCRPRGPTSPFLLLEGKATQRISIVGNDFTATRRAIQAGPDVADDAATEAGNVAFGE